MKRHITFLEHSKLNTSSRKEICSSKQIRLAARISFSATLDI